MAKVVWMLAAATFGAVAMYGAVSALGDAALTHWVTGAASAYLAAYATHHAALQHQLRIERRRTLRVVNSEWEVPRG